MTTQSVTHKMHTNTTAPTHWKFKAKLIGINTVQKSKNEMEKESVTHSTKIFINKGVQIMMIFTAVWIKKTVSDLTR